MKSSVDQQIKATLNSDDETIREAGESLLELFKLKFTLDAYCSANPQILPLVKQIYEAANTIQIAAASYQEDMDNLGKSPEVFAEDSAEEEQAAFLLDQWKPDGDPQ